MWLPIVRTLEDSRHASNPERTNTQHVCRAHIVDVWSCPASVKQLTHVSASLMVAADEDSEIGCLSFSGIVLVEVTHFAVFVWYGHSVEILSVTDGLEVAADDD